MTTLGGYTLLGELGRGGMGVVYRAEREGVPVALKVLLGQAGADEVQRFHREAQALLTLSHPGVVRLLDAGVDRGRRYLAMELVEGESLGRRLERGGPLEPSSATRILVEIAEAVEHAHERGVLHRDLKPDNVLLSRAGEPKVADFGLAKAFLGDHPRLSQTGEVLGTPAFMAPEQAEGLGAVGVATDVYGLGATLYAVLTGRPPFTGHSLLDTLQRVMLEPPAPLPPSVEVPPELEAICARCLAKDPAQRFASAAELAEALRGLLYTGAETVGRRGRGRWIVAGGAALAVAGGVAWWARPELPQAELPQREVEVAPARASEDVLEEELAGPSAEDRAEAARQLQSAWQSYGLGDHALALRTLEDVVRLDPTSDMAYVLKALTLLHAGTPAEALEALDAAPPTAAERVEYWNARSQVLESAQDLPAALAAAQEALRCDPDFANAVMQRGKILFLVGRHREAKADFEQYLDLQPGHPNGLHNLAFAHKALGEVEAAAESFRECAFLEPELGTLIEWATVQSDTSAFVEQLQDLCRAYPERHSPALMYGWVRLLQGNQVGLDLLQQIRVRPDAPITLTELLEPILRRLQGHRALTYERLLQLAPEHPEAAEWRRRLEPLRRRPG